MVWKKLIGKTEEEEEEEEIDIEAYLSELDIREGKIIEREDIVYVKPIDISGEDNLEEVKAELNKNNIVVANVKNILSDKLILREIVDKLKNMCAEIGGDLGRISEYKILVVPSGMRIVHRA